MFRDHGWLFERAINHFEETKTFIDDNTNCHNERVTIIMQFMPGKFYRTVEKRSWWSWSMADSDYHAKNSHKWLFKIHFYLRILVFPQSLTLNIPACFYGTFKLRLRRNIRLRQQMHKRLSALFPRLGKKIVVVFIIKWDSCRLCLIHLQTTFSGLKLIRLAKSGLYVLLFILAKVIGRDC